MKQMLMIVGFIGSSLGTTLAQDAVQEPAKPMTAAQMTRTQRADAMQRAPVHTFYLKHAVQPNDANEILTGLRLMLDPSIKIYLVPSQRAISLRALPDDLALATQLIAEYDRPRPAFRLTYVLSEFDGGKKVSSQKYTMALEDGQRETMKQGTRVPVETGKYNLETSSASTQVSYTDIGLNFDVTASVDEGGAMIKSRVEQSTLVDDKAGPAGLHPVIKQANVEGVYPLSYGKPVVLGSMETPGSTHRMEVEAVLEKLN